MRTINRQPYTVKQLDYDNIDYKFFNHSEWKGIAESSNYIAVDQETFADAQNMYIDKEGMLHSRPSIKPCNVVNNFADKGKIIDVKVFNQYIVVIVSDDEKNTKTAYFCTFENDILNYQNNAYVKIDSVDINSTKDYFITFAHEKIYIFTKTGLISYDTVTNEVIDNAIADIYIPTTEAYFNTIKSDRNFESENELTTGKIITYDYQYSDDGEVTIEDYYSHYWRTGLKGKNTIVKINNKLFNKYLDSNSYKTFVDETTTVNITDDAISNGIVSRDNIVVITCRNSSNIYYAMYSLDYGVTWKVTPNLEQESKRLNGYTLFQISEDGNLIYWIHGFDEKKGLKLRVSLYSIRPDNGIFTFENWTDLGEYLDIDDELTLPDHRSKYATYIPAICIKSYNEFCVVSLTRDDDYNPIYGNSNLKYYLNFTRYSSGNLNVIKIIELDPVQIYQWSYYERSFELLGLMFTYDNADNIYGYGILEYYEKLITTDNNTFTNRFRNSIYLTNNNIYTYNGTKLKTYNFVSNIDETVPKHNTVPEYYTYLYNSTYFENFNTICHCISNTDTSTLLKVVDVNNLETYSIGYVNLSKERVIGSNDLLLTSGALYSLNSSVSSIPLPSSKLPVFSNPLMYVQNNTFYTQAAVKTISIQDKYIDNYNWLNFENQAELSSIFLSSGKNLYITAIGAYSEDFQWYLPKLNTQSFDYNIQKLHPISDTILAIFFENSIQYVAYDNENNVYLYNKSRIPLGILKDSDVITTFDNKYTIFPTKRGLVAMSYQDFISSTEQSLNFLTDVIFSRFDKWHNNEQVKLFQYKYWIICYKPDSYISYVLDLRNTSWWCESYKQYVDNIYEINYTAYLFVDGTFKKFNESSIDYYDGPSEKSVLINWYFRSQKLHFSAINYYKHIVSMTLSCVSDIDLNPFDNIPFAKSEYGETKEFVLKVINYRKLPQVGGNTAQQNRGDTTAQTEVAMIRIFTKRLNYYKVNEFQYSMSSMTGSKTFKPMCLNNISIKYLITGQVR